MTSENSPLTNDLIAEQMVHDTPIENIDAAGRSEQSNWLKRNYLKLSLGALVVGAGVTMATNPLDHMEKQVVEAAPWALGGLGATEGMWIGGAALMAGSAGKRIGNPFTLRSRWGEISQSIVDSPGFKAGLAINTIGALGTAGVIAAGAGTSLPPETWPGAFGLAAGDMAGTVAFRAPIVAAIKKNKAEATVAKSEQSVAPRVKVRPARLDDMERLSEIDLLLFEKAYGQELPEKEEIKDMLTRRFLNNPDWMFVSEVNGEIEGFVTAFRTNVPFEEFVSWEKSTANGTLDGKVDPNGRYVYVANMTIKHEAVELGAEDMLLANLFANGIHDGVEYGYFVARMPYFKRWLQAEGHNPGSREELNALAEQYMELRDEKGKRQDKQLKMYESYGFQLKRLVAKAFEDDASMDYGVVFKANVPPTDALKKIKPVRVAMGAALRQVAKHPKLLQKVL